jgi:tetratricopeptide (TPR) repeat protein
VPYVGPREKAKTGGALAPSTVTATKSRAQEPRSTLSRRQKWLLRLAITIVSPLLFLIVLEVGLRLGGYGHPTSFLIGPDADGVYTSNLQFGWRFFPRSVARTPVPCFLSTKPAGAVRIFILGSSAAQGVPDPTFSVGRTLEVLLRERYPDVKFEVVNAAMTAINSHVAVEIAHDCAAHQPDLFVVYMGNNEVVGPYGPGTVFQQWSPSRRLIRANVWLKSTRVGQLLGDAIGWLRPRNGSPTAWQGLEMFMGNHVAADDPRLPAVYDNFRQNLIEICRVGRRAGAGVVLSTVAVNLKDCPPFAAQHRSGLSPEELTKWQALYDAGVKLENARKWPEAIAKYEAAVQIDNCFADLPFRLGRCLSALGRLTEARDQFVLARDLDTLRFRADSQINAAICEVASQEETEGVRLVDAERSFAKSDLAVGGIPGERLFYEHVHFTFDGTYLLARTVLEEVEAALPRLAASRRQEPVLSKEQCAELLTLTTWDEYQMVNLTAEVLSRPPFTSQLDHVLRETSARRQAEKLGRLAATHGAIEAAFRTCEAALERSPDDWQGHHRVAKLALASGRPQTAMEHLRIVVKKMPRDPDVNMNLGNAAQKCGRIDEAIACFRRALENDPGLVMANYSLASALSRHGQIDEAILSFQKAVEADPKFVMAHNDLGTALERRGRIDEAIAEYQKAVELKPEFALTHFNLGNALDIRGRIDEAVAQYQKALENDPQFAMAHNKLGTALVGRGQIDEAIAHFQKALEIQPDFPAARAGLKKP